MTGKDPEESLWADRNTAKTVVDSWYIDYNKASDEELLGFLGHGIPLVRRHAALPLLREQLDELLGGRLLDERR